MTDRAILKVPIIAGVLISPKETILSTVTKTKFGYVRDFGQFSNSAVLVYPTINVTGSIYVRFCTDLN